MEAIISKYNSYRSKDQLELEVRMGDVTRELFADCIRKVNGNDRFQPAEIINHTDVIREAGNRREVKRRIYGSKMEVEIYSKKSIAPPYRESDSLSYSINLSEERRIDNLSVAEEECKVRMKIRLRYAIQPWWLDLTAIREEQVRDVVSQLKYIKDKLFTKKLTFATAADEIPYDYINRFSVELEYDNSRPVTAEDFSVLTYLIDLLDPEFKSRQLHKSMLKRIATMVGERGPEGPSSLKSVSNQAVTLTKNLYYEKLWEKPSLVTDKADGTRCIVLAEKSHCYVITENGTKEYTDEASSVPLMVADGELVNGEIFLFDCISHQGKVVAELPLSSRISHLQDCCKVASSYGVKCQPKVYFTAEPLRLKDQLEELWHKKRTYPVDGIVFSTPDQSYANTVNYKWKPAELLSIDFLAMKLPSEHSGKPPYTNRPDSVTYLLFVGISAEMQQNIGIRKLPFYHKLFPFVSPNYFPIQFSPSVNPHAYVYYHPKKSPDVSGKIVEMVMADGEWKLLRVREDRGIDKKDFGNNFRTAEINYTGYVDPFPLQCLYDRCAGYFETKSEITYRSANKLQRFAISKTMQSHFRGAKRVIDEGSGRGADLGRYTGIDDVLFVDKDPSAIAELVRRKFSMTNRNIKKVLAEGSKPSKLPRVHVMVADMRLPPEIMVWKMKEMGFLEGEMDGIICNFAFHYFCDSLEHMTNVLTLNSRMMKKGGIFMMTVMDGNLVFDRLKTLENGGYYDIHDGETKKYSVRRMYGGKSQTNAGQMIEVKLPFASEYYSEPLCNLSSVDRVASKLGLVAVEKIKMDSAVGPFRELFPGLAKGLTQADLEYISMFTIAIYKKN